MVNDFENMVTGTIDYRGIKFTFVFDRDELRLIPPVEQKRTVELWFMKELRQGVYTIGEPVVMEEEVLVGKCNEGWQIIFFPEVGRPVGRINSVIIVGVQAYIWKKSNCDEFDRIAFQSPELDCIYPCKEAIDTTTWCDTGEYKVETKPFSDMSTQKQQFIVNGTDVNINFGVSITAGGDYTKPPFNLHTEMYFEFEPTTNYALIFRLCNIAIEFIRYLCYRENVPFTNIKLSSPFIGGKHMHSANLYILAEQGETESKCLKDKRYIRQKYINGFEGKILSDIADGLLYTRNIPPSYRQGRIIDAARFVMITAAFEWEFGRLYPCGINKKAATVKAEITAEEAINGLIENSTGKLKKIYKNLLNSIDFTQLSSKIVHTGKELGLIIDLFGKRVYRNSDYELNYTQIGERLARQRNNFAHGNLDKEFVDPSLWDLVFLEMVVYAMQLKYYGVSNIDIQKAINELFRQNITIDDSE